MTIPDSCSKALAQWVGKAPRVVRSVARACQLLERRVPLGAWRLNYPLGLLRQVPLRAQVVRRRELLQQVLWQRVLRQSLVRPLLPL